MTNDIDDTSTVTSADLSDSSSSSSVSMEGSGTIAELRVWIQNCNINALRYNMRVSGQTLVGVVLICFPLSLKLLLYKPRYVLLVKD